MRAPSVWVSPASGRGWHTKTAGDSKSISPHPTQKKAIAEGKARAKELGAELIIQGRDGRIREKDSFGHDPRHVKG